MTAIDASGSFSSLAAWHELRTRTLPRQRRRRMVMAALWVAILGVLTTNLYILSQRNVTTAVSFDDALRNFRATAGTGAAPVALASATPEVTPAGVADAHVSIPQNDATAEQIPIAGPTRSTAPTASNTLSPFFRPPEGVYSYRTSGGESVSVAGASHKYPERTYATVRYLDGCNWEIRNDVIEEHTDRRIMCSQYGTLTQLVQERQVEFFGQRDGMEVACKPPMLMSRVGEPISTVTIGDCNTDELSVRTRRSVAGYADVPIGGRSVPAVHLVIDAEFSGRANGTAHEELWLARDTGMTLRWQRTVDTVADAAFGAKVRYQENATFVLESLTPQT